MLPYLKEKNYRVWPPLSFENFWILRLYFSTKNPSFEYFLWIFQKITRNHLILFQHSKITACRDFHWVTLASFLTIFQKWCGVKYVSLRYKQIYFTRSRFLVHLLSIEIMELLLNFHYPFEWFQLQNVISLKLEKFSTWVHKLVTTILSLLVRVPKLSE